MLKILVIDESRSRAGEICAGLALAGHQVVAVLAGATDLTSEVSRIRPDIILIDTKAPSRDTLEHLAAMNRDMPRPVVIFAQASDDATIRKAIAAGVAAYVIDGLEPGRIKPVIEVAIARFEAHQALRQELSAATKKLSDRKLVERAKGILMKSRGIDEEAAYASLRRLAMDRGQPLAQAAKDVVDMAKVLL
ncbi:MAG: ANTAR domain-containing protein [Rhodocyclaceae bacterium]|nr:MAG: ANTAR domain-containing protein [Rhodocyclaceae bacterium]